MFQAAGVDLDADTIVARLTARVQEQLAEHGVPWRPGARELLEALREASVPTALVTMSVRSMADDVVRAIPFEAFDVIVTGRLGRARRSRTPSRTSPAAAALGVDIRDCVAIEDSPAGLASAWSAGAVTVGVPNILPLDEAPARRAVADARREVGVGCRGTPRRTGGPRMSESRGERSGPFRSGDRVQLTGPKGRMHTITLEPGKLFHSHKGADRARRPHRAARRLRRGQPGRRRVPRAAAAAQRLRDVDAARRGDRVPQGRRADPRAGRHLPRRHRRRGGRRLRRAVALAAPRRSGRPAASCRSSAARSSPRSRAATSRRSTATTPRTGRSRSATSRRRCPSRRPRHPSTAWCSTCWHRGSASTPVSDGAEARWRAALLHRHRHAALARGRGDPRHRHVHRAAVVRDHGARLARAGSRRASRPPHDRAHRVPPHRAPARARHGAARAEAAPVEDRVQRRGRRGVDARRARRTRRERQGAPQAGASSGCRGRALPGRQTPTPTDADPDPTDAEPPGEAL